MLLVHSGAFSGAGSSLVECMMQAFVKHSSGVAGTLLALLVHFGAFSGAGSSLVECMVQSGQWLYFVQ